MLFYTPCDVLEHSYSCAGLCAKFAFTHLPALVGVGSRSSDKGDIGELVAIVVCDHAP